MVKLNNNLLYRIGKMARLASNHFPYIIYDAAENKVLVQANGAIVNRRGNEVGRLLRA